MSSRNKAFVKNQKRCILSVGRHCRDKRISCSITQKELAERFGTTQVTLSKFERGKIDSLSIYFMYCLEFGDII